MPSSTQLSSVRESEDVVVQVGIVGGCLVVRALSNLALPLAVVTSHGGETFSLLVGDGQD